LIDQLGSTEDIFAIQSLNAPSNDFANGSTDLFSSGEAPPASAKTAGADDFFSDMMNDFTPQKPAASAAPAAASSASSDFDFFGDFSGQAAAPTRPNAGPNDSSGSSAVDNLHHQQEEQVLH
jgi:hypothetical protein